MTKKFTKDHEWLTVEGDTATVGITHYAQEQLGDVVYVELPESGRAVEQGGEAAVVESVKAASEVYAPISGTITEANGALEDAPATVNDGPEAEGWFFKMKVEKPDELDALLDEAAYKALLETL